MSITSSTQSITARIAERLAGAVGQRKFAMWFDQSARFDFKADQNALTVSVPNRFVADWIGKHFQGDLQSAADSEAGCSVQLSVQVSPQDFGAATPPVADLPSNDHAHAAPAPRFGDSVAAVSSSSSINPAAAPVPRHLSVLASDDSTVKPHEPAVRRPQNAPLSHLQPVVMSRPVPRGSAGRKMRHRLEDFVVGPSNELAFAAASRVADDDAATAGHPLFIHGGCGLGKTHLLQGICQRHLSREPGAKVLYVTGEQFTNDYIAAVRTNKLDAFRNRVRKLDLLAIDDIHFIANKQATQQEFLHCFDHIELGGARVVLASDSHPKLIKQFSEALVSRCVRGMVVQIHEPDTETRERLVRVLAERRNMVLQPSAANAIAQHCDGSVREIEGVLTKLHALASLTGSGSSSRLGGITEPIGHTLVDRLFQHDAPRTRKKPIRFDEIAKTVSEELQIDCGQILGSSRNKHVVLARSITIYLAYELTSMSYPEIAGQMGRKTHSTIITAAKRMKKQIETGEAMLLPSEATAVTPKELVDRITRILKRG
ncbi:chromosomal replication initiator protein DnaA [Poriferisphaera sp. WC338]|uniref:chromosomal replication initiator protein DnaA n=1 Tax=Poriferisphaera sp. WC338 TaxID=3425129 RepID=UPI003D817A5F